MADDNKPDYLAALASDRNRAQLRVISGGAASPPGGGDAASGTGDGDGDLRPVWCSDDALAEALSKGAKTETTKGPDGLGEDWRHVPQSGEWYHWTGQRWEAGGLHQVLAISRRICRFFGNACDNQKLARQVSSKTAIYAAAKLAGDDPRHATPLDAFDTDPWLLNTPAGVADLRNDRIIPHAREQMMTHMTAVAPEGECPHWLDFIRQCTQGNRELEAYLQRVAGYCHTASVEEHAFFFIHGPTRNGKTTFVEMLAASVGDYAITADMNLFTVAKGERHPEELAILAGKRLVTASETTKGKPWDEARLKVLTGGDRIRARFMRSNSFEFAPTWKLLFAGNHRPPMRSLDKALMARMHLIPFRRPTIPPEQRNKKLPEILRAELGGILRWSLGGVARWREKGLAPPELVLKATKEYFETEDKLGRWIAQRCVEGVQCESLTRTLYRDYRSWSAAAGEFWMSEKTFSEELEERGYLKAQHPKTRQSMFRGIATLLSPEELPLDQPPKPRGLHHHDPAGAEPWRTDPGDDFPRD
jgi:putative DNA primase/helicase